LKGVGQLMTTNSFFGKVFIARLATEHWTHSVFVPATETPSNLHRSALPIYVRSVTYYCVLIPLHPPYQHTHNKTKKETQN